jgi:hypothetical protein
LFETNRQFMRSAVIVMVTVESVALLKESGKRACDYQGLFSHVGWFSSNRMAMPERACSMRG